MSTPSPATPWIPLWDLTPPPVVPTPVNGKWLKGSTGGAMIWSDAPPPPTGLVVPDTDWQIPSLMNGWVQYGAPYGPVRYRKLSTNVVVMEGLIQGGTVGLDAFILPVGYRPSPNAGGAYRDHIFQAAQGGGVAAEAVRIDSNGEVRTQTPGSVTWIDFSGVVFYAG